MTVYERPRGPICYEVPSLHNFQPAGELPAQLLSLGLVWYWTGARSHPIGVAGGDPTLPAERGLTRLDSSSAGWLVEDWAETDDDGYGRYIAMFGLAPAEQALDRGTLRSVLRRFVASEEGPLAVVVVQIGDSPSDLVFAPRAPTPAVGALLALYGVGDPDKIRRRRRYEDLRLARLEVLMSDSTNDAE